MKRISGIGVVEQTETKKEELRSTEIQVVGSETSKIEPPVSGIASAIYASLMLAFAGIGDAFLYPFLPLNYSSVGVPIGAVGFLLSVNRFIRIFTNHWMAGVFGRFGFRNISILASFLSILTTITYGFTKVLWIWIGVRILWGLCFSALRLSSLSYSLDSKRKGLSLGINGSINELGPIVALIVGPVLLSFLNAKFSFLILGIVSIPALFFSYKLPPLKYIRAARTPLFLSWPDSFNLLIFLSAVVVEGILIVLVAAILKEENFNLTALEIMALASIYLNFRRICKLVLSPFAGLLSDRIGFSKVFSASLLGICIGLLVLSFAHVSFGLIIIFVFNGINNAVVPGSSSECVKDKVYAVSETSTWRDLGAALGTLVGGFCLDFDNLISFFWIPSFLMLVLLYFHQTKSPIALKQF